jgi:molybdenum cofactor cytidylyltransferase
MVFSKSMFDQLAALHGDKAAWKLVDANRSSTQEVHFDMAVPEDINTVSDFERQAAASETASQK